MGIDEGSKIVELFDGKEWYITTLRDAEFMIKVLNAYRYREVEGSVDGGVTWKERYEEELELLNINVCNLMKWRVKEE